MWLLSCGETITDKFLQDPFLSVGTHLSESSQNASKVDRAKDLSRRGLKMSITVTWQLCCEIGVPLYELGPEENERLLVVLEG